MSENTAASPAFNPFAEKVIKRDYTQDMIKADIGELSEAEAHEDIPEPTYDVPNIQQPNTNDVPKSSASSSFSEPSSESYSEPKPAANPQLNDLDEKQKRKAAKETAEAILTAYGRFAPMPFIKISSYNMNKMNKLNMTGEIDFKMPVTAEGVVVKNYMEDFNTQVENTFEITDAMKEEIRDPLIDVLMEQGLALTPTQRLMMAIGGHVIQMGVSTFQLVQAKKDSLETFKEWKKERDTIQRNKVTYAAPQPPQAQEPITEEKINRATEQYEAPAQTEIYEKPTFGMDDYMNSDIPDNDSTITIEEVESE